MPYSSEISRDNPTAILFVIDQSGSMDEQMTSGKSKAVFVADVLNKTFYTLVTNCTKADGVRNYFNVGVIGYGGTESDPVWVGPSRVRLFTQSPPWRIRRCGSRTGLGLRMTVQEVFLSAG
jgi:hypothetical protein